mmetsp:Transcript_116342/g.361408  ORF Transcript_116342/g.361408 Transcript_116342/m.361408 type:complete len:138 (-) Transcript_116342:150-563(-)
MAGMMDSTMGLASPAEVRPKVSDVTEEYVRQLEEAVWGLWHFQESRAKMLAEKGRALEEEEHSQFCSSTNTTNSKHECRCSSTSSQRLSWPVILRGMARPPLPVEGGAACSLSLALGLTTALVAAWGARRTSAASAR